MIDIFDTLVEEINIRGFTVLQNAIQHDSLPMLLNELQLVYSNEAINSPLEILIPRIVEHSSVFASLALNPVVLRLIAKTLGDDIHLIINQGHIKPPKSTAHTVVHSDLLHLKGVPHHLSKLMLKVMYFLSDIDEGSGGLQVYPGTHSVVHKNYPPAAPTDVKARYLAVRAGDAVIFNPAILHTATDNNSENPRLSLTFAYAHTWMRVFSGFEFSEDFLQRVRTMPEPYARQVFGDTVPYTTHAAVAI